MCDTQRQFAPGEKCDDFPNKACRDKEWCGDSCCNYCDTADCCDKAATGGTCPTTHPNATNCFLLQHGRGEKCSHDEECCMHFTVYPETQADNSTSYPSNWFERQFEAREVVTSYAVAEAQSACPNALHLDCSQASRDDAQTDTTACTDPSDFNKHYRRWMKYRTCDNNDNDNNNNNGYPAGSCGAHAWGSHQDGCSKCGDNSSPYDQGNIGGLETQGDSAEVCCFQSSGSAPTFSGGKCGHHQWGAHQDGCTKCTGDKAPYDQGNAMLEQNGDDADTCCYDKNSSPPSSYPPGTCGAHRWGSHQDGCTKCDGATIPYAMGAPGLQVHGDSQAACCQNKGAVATFTALTCGEKEWGADRDGLCKCGSGKSPYAADDDHLRDTFSDNAEACCRHEDGNAYPAGSCGHHEWGSHQHGHSKCTGIWSPYDEGGPALQAAGDSVSACCHARRLAKITCLFDTGKVKVETYAAGSTQCSVEDSCRMKREFAPDTKGCADTQGTSHMSSPCSDAADASACATHGQSTDNTECCEWGPSVEEKDSGDCFHSRGADTAMLGGGGAQITCNVGGSTANTVTVQRYSDGTCTGPGQGTAETHAFDDGDDALCFGDAGPPSDAGIGVCYCEERKVGPDAAGNYDFHGDHAHVTHGIHASQHVDCDGPLYGCCNSLAPNGLMRDCSQASRNSGSMSADDLATCNEDPNGDYYKYYQNWVCEGTFSVDDNYCCVEAKFGPDSNSDDYSFSLSRDGSGQAGSPMINHGCQDIDCCHGGLVRDCSQANRDSGTMSSDDLATCNEEPDNQDLHKYFVLWTNESVCPSASAFCCVETKTHAHGEEETYVACRDSNCCMNGVFRDCTQANRDSGSFASNEQNQWCGDDDFGIYSQQWEMHAVCGDEDGGDGDDPWSPSQKCQDAFAVVADGVPMTKPPLEGRSIDGPCIKGFQPQDGPPQSLRRPRGDCAECKEAADIFFGAECNGYSPGPDCGYCDDALSFFEDCKTVDEDEKWVFTQSITFVGISKTDVDGIAECGGDDVSASGKKDCSWGQLARALAAAFGVPAWDVQITETYRTSVGGVAAARVDFEVTVADRTKAEDVEEDMECLADDCSRSVMPDILDKIESAMGITDPKNKISATAEDPTSEAPQSTMLMDGTARPTLHRAAAWTAAAAAAGSAVVAFRLLMVR